ncbi:MAG: RNA polymerase sigma factor [bacterium]
METIEKLREELLVIRCRLGELSAYRELVEMFESRLLYYIRRIVNDEESAYDILQEVWLVVLHRIKILRDTKAFRSWLYKIAHDKAVSKIRSEIVLEKTRVEFQIHNSDFVEWEWNVDLITIIHRLLDQLPIQQREVFILFFLEELNYEEIAKITGTNIGTVKSRLFYAKKAIRAHLKEYKNV